VTIRTAPMPAPHGLVPWGLTACAVVAGPALLTTAQLEPALTLALASPAVGLTVFALGVSLRLGWSSARVAVPVSPPRRGPRSSLP
jgi:hypothetical protein